MQLTVKSCTKQCPKYLVTQVNDQMLKIPDEVWMKVSNVDKVQLKKHVFAFLDKLGAVCTITINGFLVASNRNCT